MPWFRRICGQTKEVMGKTGFMGKAASGYAHFYYSELRYLGSLRCISSKRSMRPFSSTFLASSSCTSQWMVFASVKGIGRVPDYRHYTRPRGFSERGSLRAPRGLGVPLPPQAHSIFFSAFITEGLFMKLASSCWALAREMVSLSSLGFFPSYFFSLGFFL